MVTADVKGVTKYYDELSETWTPEDELPNKDIWDQFTNDQQKTWLVLYIQFKKAYKVEIIRHSKD